MDNLLTIFMFTLITLPITIIIIFIPYWTRRTESFGISIPENMYDHKKLRNMRKVYALKMTLISVGILLSFPLIYIVLQPKESTFTIIYTVVTFSYLILSFFIYLTYHRQMKKYKQKNSWFQKQQHVVIDTKFRNEKLTLSNIFYTIPAMIVLLTFLLTIIYYDLFPKEIPMNYSLTGKVTSTVTKSYRSVFMMPILQLFLLGIFIFVNVVIQKAKQQLSAENPEQSRKQNIIFRRRWSIFLFFSGLGLTIMLSFVQLSLIYPFHPTLLFSLFLIVISAILIGSIVLSITTGQGGSRVQLATNTTSKRVNRDDDMYWKLGQFYFNREDPALFLEKRFGVGWTVNWARPLVWIILLLIIGVAFLIPTLLTH